MKRLILFFVLLSGVLSLKAQNTARIFRTEVTPYDNRKDAELGNKAQAGKWIAFSPQVESRQAQCRIEIPKAWGMGDVYLHIETAPAAYRLWINDREVACVEDLAAPAEFLVTPYVTEGNNDFRLEFIDPENRQLSPHLAYGKSFAESRLYYQDRRAVQDYVVAIVPDTLGRDFGILKLDAVVGNHFNYEEQVKVHFDIYSPEGKLIDHNNVAVTVAGGGRDTVHFETPVYGAYRYKWQSGVRRPSLYRVMLFISRQGAFSEYMPMRVGFGKTEWSEGKLMRFGKELTLRKVKYNATDKKSTLLKLASYKKQGFNTICPDYPQPTWFYEECDKLGLYVIDQADIDIEKGRDDRTVGGTLSNDPTLKDEFLERIKAMYYRSRNFSCVVAYSLGAPSGNGYNMYKAYEWLKSVEKSRPVIYSDADGEWNTDL